MFYIILGTLTEYFSKYGEVDSVELKKDNVTQKSRGFGFVTFKEAPALDLVSFQVIKLDNLNTYIFADCSHLTIYLI